MKEPATRYLVLSSGGKVQGFVTWQIDTEEGDIVIYWYSQSRLTHLTNLLQMVSGDGSYELQLSPEIQGSGLGRQLMAILEHVGKQLGTRRAMLTVFTSNASALSFYTKLG